MAEAKGGRRMRRTRWVILRKKRQRLGGKKGNNLKGNRDVRVQELSERSSTPWGRAACQKKRRSMYWREKRMERLEKRKGLRFGTGGDPGRKFSPQLARGNLLFIKGGGPLGKSCSKGRPRCVSLSPQAQGGLIG